jgi:hypothetical protein
VVLGEARQVKRNEAREVWDCVVEIDGNTRGTVLTVFMPGPLDQVNTSLQPADAARKCALAFAELPSLGIPTPELLGYAEHGDEAVILLEKSESVPWTTGVRVQAARVLASLHLLLEFDLSSNLRDLVRDSDPREARSTGGEAPPSGLCTLVHGDYFSANILSVVDGLRVMDWETFGFGDPMWDLGFLIGADRDLSTAEVESVIEAYEGAAPLNRDCLVWHKHRWDDFWEKRPKSTV